MRRLLLLISLLTSTLWCAAQSLTDTITVKFDFNHPTTLNPAQENVTSGSNMVHLTSDNAPDGFYNKSIKMSFYAEDPSNWAYITEPFYAYPVLRTNTGNQMFIEANEGDEIKKISFYGVQMGGLRLKVFNSQYTTGWYENVVHTANGMSFTVGEWDSKGRPFSKVEFINDGLDAIIDYVVVEYKAKPGSKLWVSDQTLDATYPIDVFRYNKITFSDFVKVIDASACKVLKENAPTAEDPEGTPTEYPVLLDRTGGHSIAFYTEQVLADEGKYKLVIPAGTIGSTDGVLFNEEIVIPFDVYLKSSDASYNKNPYQPGEAVDNEPDDPVEVVNVDCSISPSEQMVENLESVRVDFVTSKAVTLNKLAGIKLVSAIGIETAASSVVPVDGVANAFYIYFSKVGSGNQVLTISDGAFAVGNDLIKGFTKTYTVLSGNSYQKDFVHKYSNGEYIEKQFYIQMPGMMLNHYKEDLNEVYFYMYEWKDTGLSVNNKVDVPFVTFYGGDLIVNIKLLSTTLPDDPNQPALKLDFGQVITEDDNLIPLEMLSENLNTRFYATFPEGAFGDGNYGKYLSNSSSVDITECHVNAPFNWYIDIFKKPSGETPDDPQDPVTPPTQEDETVFNVVDDAAWTVLVGGNELVAEGYTSDELNDVTFYSPAWDNKDNVVDTSKKVELCMGITIATGTLEKVEMKQQLGSAYAYKFVPDADQDIVNIPVGEYSLIIPEGAIGDAKYGEWLKDANAVKKADCKINAQTKATIKIKRYTVSNTTEVIQGKKTGTAKGVKFTFSNTKVVSVAEGAKIVLKAEDGTEIEPSNIVTNGNSVEIYFRNLQAGSYTLDVPEAAILADGHKLAGFTSSIIVPRSIEINKDLVKTWKALVADVERDVTSDEEEYVILDLNNIVLYSDQLSDVAFMANDKKVVLYDEKGQKKATGVLVSTSVFSETAGKYVPAYRVVFDKVFRKADIEESNVGAAYKLVVPEGMLGDAKYAESQTNLEISYDECAINAEFEFSLSVFATPTSISDTNAAAALAPMGTYDLSGRSANMTTRGVYVVDGKKVYKK